METPISYPRSKVKKSINGYLKSFQAKAYSALFKAWIKLWRVSIKRERAYVEKKPKQSLLHHLVGEI